MLTWTNVSCSIFARSAGKLRRKVVLDDINGLAGPASDSEDAPGLFAILGPSGAGKSTLLDILAGRKGAGYVISGDIQLNGVAMTPRALRRASGYVPQDDVLPGTSTVWEYLMFHAELRLPRDTPRAQRRRRVRLTLDALGLARLADAPIGDQFQRGLSGGEKRRVSIAAELITQPGVLYLDEPTTGLDSSNASKVVDILGSLAAGGVTAVLSIHQPRPDIFRLLSRVLVLSGAGQMVYSGPSALAQAHFASMGHAPPDGVHIADYMLDAVLRAPPEEVSRMVASFRSSEVQGANALLAERVRLQLSFQQQQAPPPPARKYVAGFWLQLRVLCGRLLRNTYRHPFLFWLHFVATLAVALCISAVFRHAGVDTGGIQDRLGALFFMLLYLSFISLGSLPVWHEERLLFARERAAGAYGANAYFTAVVLFDILPLRVLPPFFFGFITYDMIGLHARCELCLARFVLTLVLSNITATLLSMTIGAAASSVAVANVVGSLSFLAFALFGGFLLSKTAMPPYVRWLADVSFINSGFEALVVNEFHDNDVNFYFTSAVNSSVFPAPIPVTGDQVRHMFSGFAHSAQPYLSCCADSVHFWLRRSCHPPRPCCAWPDGGCLCGAHLCAAQVFRVWAAQAPVNQASGLAHRWQARAACCRRHVCTYGHRDGQPDCAAAAAKPRRGRRGRRRRAHCGRRGCAPGEHAHLARNGVLDAADTLWTQHAGSQDPGRRDRRRWTCERQRGRPRAVCHPGPVGRGQEHAA